MIRCSWFCAVTFLALSCATAEISFESACSSLPFSSVYKWDTCFSIEGLGTYDSLQNSCNQLDNGRLATGLSTADLNEILGSIYDNEAVPAEISDDKVNDADLDLFIMGFGLPLNENDGRPLQDGDTLKIMGRFPADVKTLNIGFKSQSDGTTPFSIFIDIIGLFKPVDTLQCSSSAGGAEQLLNASLAAKRDFTLEIVILTNSYEIWLDGNNALTCARPLPINTVTLLSIYGKYGTNAGSSNGTAIHSVTRGSHIYGGHAFLWLNMGLESNVWTWKSGKSKASALDSDMTWESNEPDNLDGDEHCVLVNANTGQLRDTACNAKTPALCMYEPNYKKFRYMKSLDKVGNGGELWSGAESAAACLAKCNQFPVCHSVDYNGNAKTCHLYNNASSTTASGYEHLEKI